MKHRLLFVVFFLVVSLRSLLAGGEPSTYFNIYVPPNNDAVKRNVALIVTAIRDSTQFSITDDGMDGDTDDTVSGMLMAGQSYILYIKDNGINDDAKYASGGTLKADGDYFIIESDKLVYASMSTDSDWQHDFVASVNKKSVGSKFIIYSPKTSYSNRDLNVFAYQDDTRVTISKISRSTTNQTGYTDVDMGSPRIIAQATLDIGQDIIHYSTEGRDIMASGETFLIEANKDISVQYGALWGNARDGGGYVPSANGSSSGELFYFAVPYQANGEQEIRIVSWDDANPVNLERYHQGNWVSMRNWNLDTHDPADWVGKQNGNATYPTVFRVSCAAGKKVSVFEANWMETGSIGTSDMATMLSSADGTTSGQEFLAYIAPPGNEHNAVDPFTGNKIGASLSHLYLFASDQDVNVTVTDAATGGTVYNKSFTIAAGRYADAQVSRAEWNSIYNGTGSNSGPDRPYLFVTADQKISVLNTNFNDNWMTYFGSSLAHAFALSVDGGQTSAIPGDTLSLTSSLKLEGTATLENSEVSMKLGSGVIPVSSQLRNGRNGSSIDGSIVTDEEESTITFNGVPDITPSDDYEIETSILLSPSFNNGESIEDNTVISVETVVSGEVNGQRQESMIVQGIQNNATNTSLLLMNNCSSAAIDAEYTDSWNAVWLDYDNDGWDDLFVTDKDETRPNILYRNVNGTLTKVTSGQNALLNPRGRTVAAIAADVNNDGFTDLLVVNATQQPTMLYLNDNGTFQKGANSGITIHPEYFHGASFADFDNDGLLDILITNFFVTRFHRLYKNTGNNTFRLETENAIAATSARGMAPILADYNNDGLVDVFVPNGNDSPNSFFKNLGNFRFEEVAGGDITSDARNSVSAAWGDYDNDGDQDLFVGNSSGQRNDFYVNNGDGSFTAVDTTLLTADGGHSHGAKWIDIDNDTYLDLLVNNDVGRNFLYINNGQGSFRSKTDELVSADFGNAYGQAWADYNRDGAQDVFIATHGMETNKLFCGNSTSNHWVGIRLGGTSSNRDAIGARVSVKSGGKWTHRSVLPVSGIGSQNSLTQHFGLGGETTVDSVTVRWPSGTVQHVTTGITVDVINHIEETPGVETTFLCFDDANGNGLQDANERGIENIRLNITNYSSYVVSGSGGVVLVNLEAGSYTVDVRSNDYWDLATAINLTIAGSEENLTVAVPLRAKQADYDVSIIVVHTPWRRGFTNQSVVQVANEGTRMAYPDDITLLYPDYVFAVQSERPYTRNGQQYRWLVDSLAPGEVLSFTVKDSVGLQPRTGDILPFQATVNLPESDLDPGNNTYSDQLEIVGAIDPNDILVSPRGDGEDGWIRGDQWLTYTVRFQNVGTFYATNVHITNPLSPFLDTESLEILSTSHQGSVKLDGDILRADFFNILLPDSTTNEEGSHGYLQYRIRAKQSYDGGERITNRAGIVFDFEDAIVTNEVLNTLKYDEDQGAEKLNIFPNPASGSCQVNTNMDFHQFTDGPLLVSYTIRNVLGEVISHGHLGGTHQARIDLTDLPTGMCFIDALDQQGKRYVGKVMIR